MNVVFSLLGSLHEEEMIGGFILLTSYFLNSSVVVDFLWKWVFERGI